MPAPLPADWTAIAALAASGVTLEQLAKQTGISIGTLKARSARGGWKQAAKDVTAGKVAVATSEGRMVAAATNGHQVAVNSLADDASETKASLSRYAKKAAKAAENLKDDAALGAARNVHEVARTADLLHDFGGDKGSIRVNIYQDFRPVCATEDPITIDV